MDTFDPMTGEVATAPRMPPEIAKAVIGVMRDVRTLGNDSNNPHAKYAYVSIDKFLEVIGPKMAEHGLVIMQDEVAAEIKASAPDEQGKVRSALYVRYAFNLFHESGAGWGPVYRSVALPATGPQSFGSAESYMMKRFMRALFMVPTGDKDADDTQQSEMPVGRAGAPPAQRSATRLYNPPPAQQAPSPQRAEAEKRRKELEAEIDKSMSVPDLDSIATCGAWKACFQMIQDVKITEGSSSAEASNIANRVMEGLERRIEQRKALLLEDAR